MKAGETNEAAADPMIADLPKEVLVETLSFLTPKEVGACHSVCQSIHAACLDPILWRGLAVRAYGKGIVNATAELYSSSFKRMVIDDNILGAMPTIDKGVIPSPYLYNRPDYFFTCLVVCVKYHRPSNRLRVYFDARGEWDLRPPGGSSLERKSLDFDGHFGFRSWVEDFRTTEHSLLRAQFVSELSEGRQVPGHFKGYVSFNAQALYKAGRYYFTFADTRTQWGTTRGSAEVDYPAVPLLEVREDGGLLNAFAEEGKVAYTGMTSPFEKDGDEAERRRFEGHVGKDVLRRHLHPEGVDGAGWHGGEWWK